MISTMPMAKIVSFLLLVRDLCRRELSLLFFHGMPARLVLLSPATLNDDALCRFVLLNKLYASWLTGAALHFLKIYHSYSFTDCRYFSMSSTPTQWCSGLLSTNGYYGDGREIWNISSQAASCEQAWAWGMRPACNDQRSTITPSRPKLRLLVIRTTCRVRSNSAKYLVVINIMTLRSAVLSWEWLILNNSNSDI